MKRRHQIVHMADYRNGYNEKQPESISNSEVDGWIDNVSLIISCLISKIGASISFSDHNAE